MMESDQWAIGDAVVVKAGVKAPDTGDEIGGWQGRISAIQAGEPPILTIHWDSVTLKSLPAAFIEYSVEEGLSWTGMNLEPQEASHPRPRYPQGDGRRHRRHRPRYSWRWVGASRGNGSNRS